MRKVATIMLSLACLGLHAQSPVYTKGGKPLSTENTTDPATLSRLLTASCSSDKEKVKAIFYWITEHIEYFRLKSIPALRHTRKNEFIPGEADDLPLPALNERVAVKVLKDRMAVCEGYARLFKCLCEHAGIPAEIITGYARTSRNKSAAKFVSNHSWNAVFFDGQWHLLDATWASGYSTWPAGEFVKHYDSFYFLTEPEGFANDHFPDDQRWLLLDEAPTISEFQFHPFRQRSFVKYPISSYFPSKGILNVNIGDTIRLELETKTTNEFTVIAPDSLWEETSLFEKPLYAYVQPELPVKGGKVFYNYPVQSENVQWLYVMYNNDAVLRYRLNVKRDKKERGTTATGN
jgi:transglutaminase/protease-like cytokinesis protein 3